jgi:hypothetical protein
LDGSSTDCFFFKATQLHRLQQEAMNDEIDLYGRRDVDKTFAAIFIDKAI